ncbi:flagellar hook-associated protein FlgK [Sporosarcina limicola]|uniref:Flagellar hook-associated protein 1 n=1 Tax=Sporosarcina limicola TaxID=34101 RepID=A0A927MP53_9BACL|nr:flagellar hook-associated protein FlgK [Sporosarcina limicola]MBE1555009.1 flagellar hook-associated protein 1 FlgK [Sporosarcina limicola]
MRSTFMGLETGKRGMFTQQTGLYTVGHNLGNENTLGFSRQRVNMKTTTPFPGIGLSSGTSPGFIGTGVTAHSIERVRDVFVDRQYRQETNNFGYWESRSKAMEQIEDVMTVTSGAGLDKTLSLFWQSLQELAKEPANLGVRRVVVERGVDTAAVFNNMHKQLTDIRSGLKNEIEMSTSAINSIFKQIADLNDQIQRIEPNGYLPNDLYDSRDLLLDELSTYLPIEVSYTKSGGNALKIAEGPVTVSIKTNGASIEVVKGKDFATMASDLTGAGVNDYFNNYTFAGTGVTGGTINHGELVQGKGKMLSLVNSYGYAVDKGVYPEMLKNLNDMAKAFADGFNAIHSAGYEFEKDGTGNTPQAGNFFAPTTGAGDIKVLDAIKNDPKKIGASNAANEEGNGKNALLLAGMQSATLTIDGTNTTLTSFYDSLIGKLGVDAEQAKRFTTTSAISAIAVEKRRASISSVSKDEEMINMIKFQQAYNASARMITTIDETLDRIINGMGRVGQ